MDFLERLSERERERFLAAATTVKVARGEYLIRRGERGGDVYRVVEGELEVIDGRQQPVVVLDVIGRGQMVGEMGFLQEQVRTADVRAGETSVCQRWDRGSLIKVLEVDPAFAAAFYRALAGVAVARSREITTNAMMGALAGGKVRGGESAAQQAKLICARVKSMFNDIEPLIRRDRTLAQQRLLASLHTFQTELEATFARLGPQDRQDAGEEVSAELHAYVMRSHFGEMANDREEAWVGKRRAVAHLGAHRAEGDGPLGEMIDGWFLDLPTARALRERRALAAQLVTESLPANPPNRVLCLGALSASLLASEVEAIGRHGGEIVCIESTREAVLVADADLHPRPRTLKVRLVEDDVAQICLGVARVQIPPQQVAVVDGLVEHLPERLVVSLVRGLIHRMVPGGRLVITAMSPASDELLFQHLLKWPMIRRSLATFRGLLESAGLTEVRAYEVGSAGLVAVGVRPLV